MPLDQSYGMDFTGELPGVQECLRSRGAEFRNQPRRDREGPVCWLRHPGLRSVQRSSSTTRRGRRKENSYDPKKAEQLLAKAGYTSSNPLVVPLYGSPGDGGAVITPLMALIQYQLSSIGVQVEVNNEAAVSTYFAQLIRAF